MHGLCLILDQDTLKAGAEHAFSLAVSAGVRFIQYRNKRGSRREIYRTSATLAGIARKNGVLFVVNDHADIALAADADGVHLGQDDLPIEHARKLLGREKLIGISTHTPEQAGAAEAGGADYIGFGPIFRSATKDAGEEQGVGKIALIKQAASIPLIAIGGITGSNVREVLESGADGVAVISAVLKADDIKSAAEEMTKIIQEAVDRRQQTGGAGDKR